MHPFIPLFTVVFPLDASPSPHLHPLYSARLEPLTSSPSFVLSSVVVFLFFSCHSFLDLQHSFAIPLPLFCSRLGLE